MSSISGARATPSSSRSHDTDMTDTIETNNINVNKPDLYYGDRAKLDDWLMQWDLFFMFQGDKVPTKKRVTLVASYMRGKAFTWIKPFVQQYNQGNAPEDVDAWMDDFDEFKNKIRPVFGVTNEPTIARREIQRVRQTKSAADYAAEFQQLAANTDWDDTALMTMFKQGLKPQVKTELMRTGASTDNLDDLINTAIDIDVKLYELQQELREDPRSRVVLADKRPPPRNPWRNNLSNRGQRGGHYQPNSGRRIHNDTRSGYYGPAAMDLSNINKGPDRWNKNQSKGSKPDKSKVTCYGCGKQGHFARDCRMKNKVVRQLNVLTTGDDGTGDEWEVLTEDMGCLMEDTESEHDDAQDYIDNDGRYDRVPTPYQDYEEPVATRTELKARRNRRRQRKEPMEVPTMEDTAPRRPVHEVLSGELICASEYYQAYEWEQEEDAIVAGARYHGNLFKKDGKYYAPEGREILVILGSDKQRTIWRSQSADTESTNRAIASILPGLRKLDTHPNARDSTIPVEIKEDGTRVYDTRGIHVGDGFVTDTPQRKTRQELDQARNINYSPRYQDNWCDKQSAVHDQKSSDDDEEEEYEEAEEYRNYEVTRARAYLAEDGEGLTGLNRQLANSKKTDMDWADLAFAEWENDNYVTQATLDLYNRHEPQRNEPDFCRDEATRTHHSSMIHWQDIRNPRHEELPWAYCYHGQCRVHYMAKVEARWFPSRPAGCTQAWYTCKDVKCAEHLWDKRTKQHFPGITDPQEILVMQLVLNGYCKGHYWEECLNAACKQHAIEKECCGFKGTKPFLGQRRRAPGVDPSIPQGPIHSSSSPSC
jgi:Retrotransposon gag protein/Zinc knuckle